MSAKLWSKMEDTERNNVINPISSIFAIENIYELHTSEFLPSTPNRTALQVEYCSVSATVTEVQYFKCESPSLGIKKIYNYENYYSEKCPKTIMIVFYILDYCANFPLKNKSLIFCFKKPRRQPLRLILIKCSKKDKEHLMLVALHSTKDVCINREKKPGDFKEECNLTHLHKLINMQIDSINKWQQIKQYHNHMLIFIPIDIRWKLILKTYECLNKNCISHKMHQIHTD